MKIIPDLICAKFPSIPLSIETIRRGIRWRMQNNFGISNCPPLGAKTSCPQYGTTPRTPGLFFPASIYGFLDWLIFRAKLRSFTSIYRSIVFLCDFVTEWKSKYRVSLINLFQKETCAVSDKMSMYVDDIDLYQLLGVLALLGPYEYLVWFSLKYFCRKLCNLSEGIRSTARTTI